MMPYAVMRYARALGKDVVSRTFKEHDAAERHAEKLRASGWKNVKIVRL